MHDIHGPFGNRQQPGRQWKLENVMRFKHMRAQFFRCVWMVNAGGWSDRLTYTSFSTNRVWEPSLPATTTKLVISGQKSRWLPSSFDSIQCYFWFDLSICVTWLTVSPSVRLAVLASPVEGISYVCVPFVCSCVWILLFLPKRSAETKIIIILI